MDTGERGWGLSGFTLKCIAMLTMLIDHMGMVLFPQYRWMRIIGRLAFPIFCFLLAEGAVHTSNHRKYLLRLLAFALISEVPFNLARSGMLYAPYHQNVFFTLFLGLLAITAIQKLPGQILPAVSAIVCILVASPLHTDYGSGGVLIMLVFYLFREHLFLKVFLFAIFNIGLWGGVGQGLSYVLEKTQTYAVFAIIPILCYNGKRGPSLKYPFYVFYPAHLLALHLLRLLVIFRLRGMI